MVVYVKKRAIYIERALNRLKLINSVPRKKADITLGLLRCKTEILEDRRVENFWVLEEGYKAVEKIILFVRALEVKASQADSTRLEDKKIEKQDKGIKN